MLPDGLLPFSPSEEQKMAVGSGMAFTESAHFSELGQLSGYLASTLCLVLYASALMRRSLPLEWLKRCSICCVGFTLQREIVAGEIDGLIVHLERLA